MLVPSYRHFPRLRLLITTQLLKQPTNQLIKMDTTIPPSTTQEQSTTAAAWFLLFRTFGQQPSPDTYHAVFHPTEGSVSDAGMAQPTPASHVKSAIAHVLVLLPDLTIDMQRYRVHGDAVFVEAHNRGTFRKTGTKVEWDAVYRVHLKEGLVLNGRRFYDQATLFRALAPEVVGWLHDDDVSLPPTDSSKDSSSEITTYSSIISNLDRSLHFTFSPDAIISVPDTPHPISPTSLTTHFSSLGLPSTILPTYKNHAGDASLYFIEWTASSHNEGEEEELLGMDRIELNKQGKVVNVRRFVDTLGLLAKREPKVLELRRELLSNVGSK